MDIGARLRSTREAQGISLARLAEKTRVQPRILAAIELNDLGSIPPKPFGRGFVRAYADEVGLDPDRTVHDYFGQFARAIPPSPAPAPRAPALPAFDSPRWVVPAAVAVAVGVGTILLLTSNWRTAAGEAAEPPAVGTSGATPVPARSSDSRSLPVAAAVNSTSPGELLVVIRADRAAWVAASADGKRVIYQLMPAGSQKTLRAVREISLRSGDAGAVRLTINGRDAGAFGSAGEVRDARITPVTAASFGTPPSRH